jgi:hypothetical protein
MHTWRQNRTNPWLPRQQHCQEAGQNAEPGSPQLLKQQLPLQ